MKKKIIIGILISFIFFYYLNVINDIIINDNVVNDIIINDIVDNKIINNSISNGNEIRESSLSFQEQYDRNIKDCPFCQLKAKGFTREEALAIVDEQFSD